MKQVGLILFAILSFATTGYSQTDTLKAVDVTGLGHDLKYREDQFYFSVSHNIMQQKFKSYSPSSVSLGIDLGFLRDFPINASRTVAIAPGIGYSYSNLRNNFGLDQDGGHVVLKDYNKSSLSLHSLDFPLELRWRTSTPESHKFWRIYAGVKASYVFSDRLKTTTSSYTTIKTNDSMINNWLYGAYISVGFNTWNIYTYYGMNDIYSTPPVANDDSKLRLLKIGLIFYIL